ncbi:MAG: histidine phosphatase family protein [Desulfocapsaceae bacterium]|nr:histidine phosphatase family protein [Desulfocapsaceae bacterium]
MRLILLRHGRTGLSGRYVGSSDVPLSEEGRKQILDLRSNLDALEIDGLLASPMLRCTQSADLLGLGLPMQLDPDLREIDFGRWEGKTFAEIEAQDPELVQHWASGTDDFCFPGGEGMVGFTSRVDAVKNRLLVSDAGTLLLVTHGGVIRSLICGLLGLSQRNYLLFQVAKGHYSTIDLYDGGGVLTGFNLGSRG